MIKSDGGPGDVGEIAGALQRQDIYLGEGTRDWISKKDLGQVRSTLAESDLPLKIVLVQPPSSGGISAGEDLLVRLHDAGAPDGLYVGVNNVRSSDLSGDGPHDPYSGQSQFSMAIKQWGTIHGDDDLTDEVDYYLTYGQDGDPMQLGPGLVKVTDLLAAGKVDALAQTGREGLRTSADESGPAPGAENDGGVPPLLIGGGLLALLAGAVWLVRSRRRRAGPAGSGEAFTLPDSVADRVREATASSARREARIAVVALGERLDAEEIPATASAEAATSWQLALDHYAEASMLLPIGDVEQVGLLDAVGALVLARRGDGALDAALADRAYRPTPPCLFNPLHGDGVRGRRVEHGEFAATAPVCEQCHRDLHDNQRPDVLTVMVRDRPAYYFESGREPWASTGYGALDPDLLTRLQETPRR